MKKFLLTLICLIGAIAINAQNTASVTFKNLGYGNAAEVKSVKVNDHINITFDKGSNSNTPKYYTSGNAIRVYGGGKMTIAGADKASQLIK